MNQRELDVMPCYHIWEKVLLSDAYWCNGLKEKCLHSAININSI